MKYLWIPIFLLSWIGPVGADTVEKTLVLPTQKEVSSLVHKVMREHQAEIDRFIRGVEQPEILYQLSICGYFSLKLGKYLREEGLNIYLIKYAGHYNLGVFVQDEQNQVVELIIDPTYRQFFTYEARRARYDLKRLPDLFEFAGMPEVLIVPREDLEATLNSFHLKPNWVIRPWDLYVQANGKFLIKPTRYTFDYYFQPQERSNEKFYGMENQQLRRQIALFSQKEENKF